MKNRTAMFMTHTLLIVFGIIWIYPFIWMISSSFKTNSTFLTSGINPLPENIHWDNYIRAWEVANFSGYFLNSVIITLSTVLIVITLSCLTGYALGRVKFPGRKVIITIVVALMFIPSGYTIIPLYELMKMLGLSDSIFGVVLAESSGAHILFILLFAAFFSRVPQEVEDSAAIDGAGFFRTFAKIVLPTAKPVIATAAIMQFVWTWSSFLVPLVLTLNSPELRTLAVGMLSFVGRYQTDWTGMAAGASISLVPVILIFIVMQRYFIEGISGSVK
ncbi:carbohydrate ABC transporter permease [Oceanobacillus neutriphilus]|uniref:Sugar ABC transporter permease n=1 Tax=Oceanobacillus neutriphilus TaxID=531815 RepID=A0ABQ2NYR5_9BACI|nr:carbohydrate ABC transporter permease [Oceanobacillus neutriphilus]GGP13955.1 sugar ABC transporter permease [Oceanobacillus neutriphilus]